LAPAVPGLVILIMGWQRRWTAEDAFIDFRVVRNLLAGHGPVFNVGERVEAYTSPLWVLLLAVSHAVFRVRVEYVALALGLTLTAAAVVVGGRAAVQLAAGDNPGRGLPLGMFGFVAVAAAWDFATSGLEGGLVLAWIAVCWLLLVTKRRPAATAVLIGLGPLVRPDLLLFSLAFLVGLAGITPRRDWPRLLGEAAAVPVAYQVFRMGYFAAVEPNTALAKEASAAYWSQGWRYLRDFVDTYLLWMPVAVALVIAGVQFRRQRAHGRTPEAILTVVPIGAGLVHALYVVRVGGDFMHGRLLLPSLFAVLLPATVGVGTRAKAPLLAVAIAGTWAVAGGVFLRPASVLNLRTGIADERRIWIGFSHQSHPITIGDFSETRFAADARQIVAASPHQRVVLVGPEGEPLAVTPLPLLPRVPARVVAARPSVGIIGYTTGSRALIFDQLGLANPLASRVRIHRRGRPGHEKSLGYAWMVARYADPVTPLSPNAPPADQVADAQAALACPALHHLIDAVTSPLTPSRFLGNIWHAWSVTRLRFDADPATARAELCPGSHQSAVAAASRLNCELPAWYPATYPLEADIPADGRPGCPRRPYRGT
jgi:arabinofuranosyltransferase